MGHQRFQEGSDLCYRNYLSKTEYWIGELRRIPGGIRLEDDFDGVAGFNWRPNRG